MSEPQKVSAPRSPSEPTDREIAVFCGVPPDDPRYRNFMRYLARHPEKRQTYGTIIDKIAEIEVWLQGLKEQKEEQNDQAQAGQ